MERLIYIGLGANVGDRMTALSGATEALRSVGVHPVRTSSFYRSEPVEVTDQEEFINQVAGCMTVLPPEAVLELCLGIEKSMGRVRTRVKGPRMIDLDLLLFGDEIREGRGLRLPHPRMHLRRFVLVPLVEIAPEVRHPVLGKSAAELLEICPDRSRVERFDASSQGREG